MPRPQFLIVWILENGCNDLKDTRLCIDGAVQPAANTLQNRKKRRRWVQLQDVEMSSPHGAASTAGWSNR